MVPRLILTASFEGGASLMLCNISFNSYFTNVSACFMSPPPQVVSAGSKPSYWSGGLAVHWWIFWQELHWLSQHLLTQEQVFSSKSSSRLCLCDVRTLTGTVSLFGSIKSWYQNQISTDHSRVLGFLDFTYCKCWHLLWALIMTIIVHMYVSGLCGLVNRSPVYVRVTCVLMMMLQDTELPRGYFQLLSLSLGTQPQSYL